MDREALEHRLLNDYQRDFPLEPRPFARIARDLQAAEHVVLDFVEDLQTSGTIGRIGAVVRPNTIGASTLAAMAVPEDRLEEVAAIVTARTEVNHCYEREHDINLWFVVTARRQERVARVLDELQAETGIEVLDLPMVEAYHIDLGFDLR